MKILVIPDTQVAPGVPLDHIAAAGRYIAKERPDVIVVIGDWWDFESLSYWDRGKAKAEGRRIQADLKAGHEAMELLLKPLRKLQSYQRRFKKAIYKPRMIFTYGNHEYRLDRYMDDNPALEGSFDLKQQIKDYGFEFYDFLEVAQVGSIKFSHYFANPLSGRPWGGQILNKLMKVGESFVQGHVQVLEYGERYTNSGEHQFGLVIGAFYLHDEEYKGPQGNHHFRGMAVLHHDEERTDVELMSIKRLLELY